MPKSDTNNNNKFFSTTQPTLFSLQRPLTQLSEEPYFLNFTEDDVKDLDEKQLTELLEKYINLLEPAFKKYITLSLLARPISILLLMNWIEKERFEELEEESRTYVSSIPADLKKKSDDLLSKGSKIKTDSETIRTDLELITTTLRNISSEKFKYENFYSITDLQQLDKLIHEYLDTCPIADENIPFILYDYFYFSNETVEQLAKSMFDDTNDDVTHIEKIITSAMSQSLKACIINRCDRFDELIIKVDYCRMFKEDEYNITLEAENYKKVLMTMKQHRIEIIKSNTKAEVQENSKIALQGLTGLSM